MILPMLKHEDAIALQQTFFKDEAGNRRQFLQGVGGVGEDEVKLLFTRLDESEHIPTQGHTALCSQFLQTLLDEAVMVAIHLHTDHVFAASRQQFKCDAASAREKIERCGSFEVEVLSQYVEYILLGKVCSGPCLEGPRNVEVPTFVFSCDNPHLPLISNVMRS